MIYIKLDNDTFYDDAVVMVKSFYPRADVKSYQKLQSHELTDNDMLIEAECPVTEGRTRREYHDEFKRNLYLKLNKITGQALPWGYMTGVRPSKNAYDMLEAGLDKSDIKKFFTERHYVADNKAELAISVAENELAILKDFDYKSGYSLYIGIPFCPSICLYCSFASSAIGSYSDFIEDYLAALMKEISYVSKKMSHKRLDSIYIGGGTPTTLTGAQLDRLLSHVTECFDMNTVKELTVEAGRPDSITEEKLMVLRRYNVDRISINPQTMNQETLDIIGRKHTVSDIIDKFNLARSLGFDNINMDIILALPGEGIREVTHTLEEIAALRPESLTVHTLAIKRAAALNIWKERYEELSIKNDDKVVGISYDAAIKMGMIPYYMYRQKNMAGNYENVGYCHGVDKACLYNILIMEEKQTIIACGAGASSKFIFHEADNSTRIERVENVKNVREYVSRIDEMIQRKEDFIEKEGGI